MLLTLAAAKQHLRVTDDNSNGDILTKLEQAEAIVLDYLARPSDATWTATMATWGAGSPVTAAPLAVQAAILEQLAELYSFRGDDPAYPERPPGDLAPSIKAKLYRLRLPVMA